MIIRVFKELGNVYFIGKEKRAMGHHLSSIKQAFIEASYFYFSELKPQNAKKKGLKLYNLWKFLGKPREMEVGDDV